MEARGFGFVTYADFRSAQQFLSQREHHIDGRRVDAKAAVPRNSGSGSQLTRKMFVGGTVWWGSSHCIAATHGLYLG